MAVPRAATGRIRRFATRITQERTALCGRWRRAGNDPDAKPGCGTPRAERDAAAVVSFHLSLPYVIVRRSRHHGRSRAPFRPWAIGREASPPPTSSLHRIHSVPPPCGKQTHQPTNTSSRARNSGAKEIQPLEIAEEKTGSAWLRRVVTVSIPVTMPVTSTVTIRVGIFGERKISSLEMPECASRLLSAAGRSVCGSHRSDDAASCAVWSGQGRGRDATAMTAPRA